MSAPEDLLAFQLKAVGPVCKRHVYRVITYATNSAEVGRSMCIRCRTWKKERIGSDAERALEFQLRSLHITFDREVVFAAPRRWRADFVITPGPRFEVFKDRLGNEYAALRPSPILIEIDGGTWTGGRHVTGSGHASDSEKRNAAVLLGYRPLTFSPAQVESGEALKTIEKALG